ncbi:aluminum-activated malate transporter 8 [Impatiens glandulifera]|uniref:aluminum-activated malate transporter 8 n=1 Tax=Impatiens glandulifera TaxID=253017 RepID=UPI001FB0F513|nr:aluminum-activated malate transporter 8 [Impatiens glandulifera]
MESTTQNSAGILSHGFSSIKATPGKIKEKCIEVAKNTKKTWQDDPRRAIHSIKVALALTLVSLFYYFRPLYNGFGSSGIWAVLTVVVVFEFTVGATLSKGMNRGFATFLAGGLGIGAIYIAKLAGHKGEPFLLGASVFFLAGAATFSRFFPNIKKKYDYGVLVFILTFSMIAVSGYRVNEILNLANQRIWTILVGGAICIIISIFVCPVWAGSDLHNLVAGHIQNLANFLEVFGGEYFADVSADEDKNQSSDGVKDCKEINSFLEAYKTLLSSKATEESLANFAWWEPGHGSFLFRHPWKQYLKVAGIARKCAYHIEALSGYIYSENNPTEFRKCIREPCVKMIFESSMALKELASSLKIMKSPSPTTKANIENCKASIVELRLIVLDASSKLAIKNILDVIPEITVTSILIDIVECVEMIVDAVNELACKAQFKKAKELTIAAKNADKLLHRGIVKPVNEGDESRSNGIHDVVIVVEDGLHQVPKDTGPI